MASDPPYIDEPPSGLPEKSPAAEGRIDTAKPLPLRSFSQKMFDLPWTGWIQLALVSLAVGVLLNLAQIDFTTPGFTLGRALGQLVQGIFRGLGWLVSTGWWPLLSGVVVVAPLWLIWRAVSALWRK
jgi:hypothetical protein